MKNLKEEFPNEMGISQYYTAKDIHVPPRRINEIVHGKGSITADTALRLGRYFGTSLPFWTNLPLISDEDAIVSPVSFCKKMRRMKVDSSVFPKTPDKS